MSAIRFLDDDAGYLAWKAAHEPGFIRNCAPAPRANYLMVHAASCSTLRTLRGDYRFWTHHYMKVCANARNEIDDWMV